MKTLQRGLLIGLCCVALGACGFLKSLGGDDEGPQPAPLVDLKPEIKITAAWSKNIGKGAGKRFMKLTPALEGDSIYVVDSSGLLVSLDRDSGNQQWRRKLKLPVSAGVGAGFGSIFVGTSKGLVLALNETDGSELWRANVSSEILSVPQSNGDIVVIQTVDEKVYGLDVATGEQRWFYESIIPTLTMRGSSTPVLTTNMALVGLASGKIVGLNADTGQLLWERRISVPQGSSELARMTDIDGDPLLINNLLYATSFHGNIVAIDITNARVRWQKELSSYAGVDEGFGNVYASDVTDHVYAFNLANGQSAWKQASLSYRGISAPVTFGNYVVVADYQGYVHFLAQSDGHLVARKKVDGKGVRSNMVAQGDKLYVYGNSGKLVALSVK